MKLVWACIALLAVQAASAGSSSELSTEVKVRDKRFIGDLVEGAGDILGGVGDALGGVVGALTGPLGGVIGNFIGGIFGGNKGDEAAEARHREQMAMMRNQHCIANCVSEWSPWTACSQPCGGGTTTRSRQETIPSDCGEGFSCGKQLSQEAPCNPGCPNGAVPKSGGGCECPDGFRGQCCNQVVRCDYPGRPTNGNIDGTFPAVFGTVVSFSCDEGYSLAGDSDIFCLANGQWSGRKPNCGALQCAMPSPPENGRILNQADNFVYGQEIMYMCNEGYTRVGPEVRRCGKINQKAAWTGFSPLCVEASCGDPGYPLYGKITGSDFSVGGTITVSCFTGYRLIGSSERTCMASGKWNGHDPECRPISCETPIAPRHGTVLPLKEAYVFGSSVTFRCEDGFRLDGKSKLKCQENTEGIIIGGGGIWDGEPPTCTAVICGDPGVPQQGAKDGSLYYFPNNVTFSCFAGYRLEGASSIHCDSTGTWTAPTPKCIACPIGTYKDNTRLDRPCEQCPPHTLTSTAGSNNRDQCVCDKGYKPNADGECKEILCPPLSAPAMGSMAPCENKLGSVCEVDCIDGHVLSTGSAKRQCLEDGTWSGTEPVCQACPINTFKANARICIPCPVHSHTNGDAHMESGCICDKGYHGNPGGPCNDTDECTANEGRGPCEEICNNKDGGYECDCSIPGYIIDPIDKHSCILDRTCRNLTETDAPGNGGLVCHWYLQENSQQCAVRCNKGYEFPSRVNNYEYCGPSTGYLWSHEEREEPIEPCIEELFPDFKYEAESFYFVRACNDLTPEEQEAVKRDFANMLTEQGVCIKSQTKVCDVKNVGIICGATTKRRRKRDIDGVEVEEEVQEVTMGMGVSAHKMQDRVLDCGHICTMLKIPRARCSALCETTYKRFLKAAVIYSQRQLKELFQNPQRARFLAANRDFEARENGVRTDEVQAECGEGMMPQKDLCVPCQPGTMLKDGDCKQCPVGFFQPLAKQSSCLPCPVGTTSPFAGASYCKVCPSGSYGLMCQQNCSTCVHGICNPENGECVCSSGWEGPACDQDIMGCTSQSCYPGAKCYDIRAPGTGFLCGACPEGMTGDGTFCEMIPFGTVAQPTS